MKRLIRILGMGLARLLLLTVNLWLQTRPVSCGFELRCRPLRRGASILSPEGDTVWVVFHYERLVGLCFQCGRLGHEAKACTTPLPEGCTQKPYGDYGTG